MTDHQGNGNAPIDPVSFMISIPFDLSFEYDGSIFGDVMESYPYIEKTESLLLLHGIPLPNPAKVSFSSIKAFYWLGHYFDGRVLFIVLHPDP